MSLNNLLRKIKFLVLIISMQAIFIHCHAQTTIKVTGGEITGIDTAGIRIFKGIPFAQPPIGELRWKDPQPVKPWSGIKQTTKFGATPEQSRDMASFVQAKPNFSEDCLYLNIWTPAKNNKESLPVMVWIHGGAFQFGGTSQPVFDGTNLANKNVILVSIGYRLGIFGFLAHPDLTEEQGTRSGNYALLDMIAGLRWIRENIEAFGGDPNNVTIFGESAGGIAVNMLTTSPKAKELFQRAISQSGGSMTPVRFEKNGGELVLPLNLAEEQGEEFLMTFGAKDIASARKLPASELLKSNIQWWATADNIVLGNAYNLYKNGEFNDTPILVGTTSDEGLPFTDRNITVEGYVQMMRAGFGQYADTLLAVYPHSTQKEAYKSAKDLFRESALAWPTWTWAKFQSEKGKNNAYVFYFDRTLPGYEDGAYHSQEIVYVFGNLAGLRGTTDDNDKNLSELMMNYWVNFARTGDPNGKGLPEWKNFTTDNQVVMNFDAESEMIPIPNLDKLKAWDSYFTWRRKIAEEQKKQ